MSKRRQRTDKVLLNVLGFGYLSSGDRVTVSSTHGLEQRQLDGYTHGKVDRWLRLAD